MLPRLGSPEPRRARRAWIPPGKESALCNSLGKRWALSFLCVCTCVCACARVCARSYCRLSQNPRRSPVFTFPHFWAADTNSQNTRPGKPVYRVKSMHGAVAMGHPIPASLPSLVSHTWAHTANVPAGTHTSPAAQSCVASPRVLAQPAALSWFTAAPRPGGLSVRLPGGRPQLRSPHL